MALEEFLRAVLYAALESDSRADLLRTVCNAAIQSGGATMAWVLWRDPGESSPIVVAAPDAAPPGAWELVRAYDQPHICTDCTDGDTPLSWRKAALRHGYRSAAVIPLTHKDGAGGALILYAATSGHYQNAHRHLLSDLGIAISRALAVRTRDTQLLEATAVANRYRAAIEGSADAIIAQSLDGTITGWNPAAESLFGYSASEMLGCNIATITPPDRRSESEARLARVAAGECIKEAETFHVRRDSRCVPICLTVTPIRSHEGGDEVIGALHIARAANSVPEQHAALGRKVRERTLALAIAKERAERADQLKSAFLATMSHELRTPLHSISGLCGLLIQGSAGPLNSKQSAHVNIVRDNAKHLLSLINDVLDLSKIEAGQLNLVCETFDLDRSLEHVVAMMRPLADKKRLGLSCDTRYSAGMIFSDRRRIEQILVNLVSNAIKYTDRGKIVLTSDVALEHGLSTLQQDHHVLRLSVADTGIGIEAANLSMLFQPFRQFDSHLSASRDGSGLGLAICRSLSDLLGGELQVRSVRGHGSTFILSLPLRRVRVPP